MCVCVCNSLTKAERRHLPTHFPSKRLYTGATESKPHLPLLCNSLSLSLSPSHSPRPPPTHTHTRTYTLHIYIIVRRSLARYICRHKVALPSAFSLSPSDDVQTRTYTCVYVCLYRIIRSTKRPLCATATANLSRLHICTYGPERRSSRGLITKIAPTTTTRRRSSNFALSLIYQRGRELL